jgi:hypothetical protein
MTIRLSLLAICLARALLSSYCKVPIVECGPI